MTRLILALATFLIAPLSAQATEITVTYSDHFAAQLSQSLGEREGEYLSHEITDDVRKAAERAGVMVPRIEVTIMRAVPNRPTFVQLSKGASQSFGGSFNVGGMELVGTAYDERGDVIGMYEYAWFERDISNVVGFNTWTDAHRASNRFARRFVKKLR